MEANTKNISANSIIRAFAGNHCTVLNPKVSLAILKDLLQKPPQQLQAERTVKILPFLQGKPLVSSTPVTPSWRIAWQSLYICRQLFHTTDQQVGDDNLLSNMVYLGHREEIMHWALNISREFQENCTAYFSRSEKTAFVDLRTLMIGTDWSDEVGMPELSIAGQGRAMLEWQNQAQFCSKCGIKTVPREGGRRRQCGNDICKRSLYPHLDPVVIMLVIDKAKDRALLARKSQFLPHMWSCLAGFIELGESFEEAVRRETWEEVAIEINVVVYHSSQPWPVGPASMSCQLMVGFLAFAKSFDIHVDKNELEDAQWYSREEVKKMLDFTQYKKDKKTAAFSINQPCAGVREGKRIFARY